MQDVFQLIGSYGFPIVCCLIMFYQNHKREQVTQEKHDKALEQLQTVVSENTVVLKELTTLITHFLSKGDGVNG